MLKGKGTNEDPLFACYCELADITAMVDAEDRREGIVVIVRNTTIDELIAIAFSHDDFREMAERGLELINMNGT